MNRTLTPTNAPIESPLVYLSSHYIRAKEHLEAIVASTSDAICTTDMKGRVIFFNPGAAKMLGVHPRDVVGLPVHRFYEGGKGEAEKIMKLLNEHGSLTNFETAVLAGGRRIWISLSASFIKDKQGRRIGTLGISKDITKRVELERKLRELSITDNLTGLYNQRHLAERAAVEVQRAKRQRHRLSVVVIDLDHFKMVNDHFGHLEGDRVLQEVSEAIRKSIRAGVDAAFRYGGDEFVLILPGTSAKGAEAVVRRVRQALQAGRKDTISLSHGVAALKTGDSSAELMRRADAAMYAAKRGKRS